MRRLQSSLRLLLIRHNLSLFLLTYVIKVILNHDFISTNLVVISITTGRIRIPRCMREKCIGENFYKRSFFFILLEMVDEKCFSKNGLPWVLSFRRFWFHRSNTDAQFRSRIFHDRPNLLRSNEQNENIVRYFSIVGRLRKKSENRKSLVLVT